MLTVNENGKQVSFWGALGQIAISALAGYGMSRCENNDISWNGFRNNMIMNMGATAMEFTMEQAQKASMPKAEPAQKVI